MSTVFWVRKRFVPAALRSASGVGFMRERNDGFSAHFVLLYMEMHNIQPSPLSTLLAQVFDGPGLEGGLTEAEGVTGIATGEPRTIIVNILNAVLDYAALLGVIMVIVAGFYLLFSFGEEERKEKATKIIFYTLIGLAVLLFARVIVGIVTVVLSDAAGT